MQFRLVLTIGFLPLMLMTTNACQSQEAVGLPETNFYEITTPMGRMIVRLYDETPGHRDNFKKLVAEGFYDGTTFHRVISRFMIQGGDPNSRDEDPMNDGNGGPGYTIPAEVRPGLFHKRGALATARTPDNANPNRESSGSQFYIVHGTIYTQDVLLQIENHLRQAIPDSLFAFSGEAMETYTTAGGSPILDGMYTVFGELVEGFEVLDNITRVVTPKDLGQTNSPVANRPMMPVTMQIRALADYAE